MSNPKHITRIEQGNFKTWWVRFLDRKRNGKQPNKISKSFPDKRWGGKRKALQMAIAWRDQMLADHGDELKNSSPSTHLKKRFHVKPHANNTSGIVGVHLSDREGRNPQWVATWNQQGQTRSKGFVFDRDDEQASARALRKAKKCRRDAIKQHYKGPIGLDV